MRYYVSIISKADNLPMLSRKPFDCEASQIQGEAQAMLENLASSFSYPSTAFRSVIEEN